MRIVPHSLQTSKIPGSPRGNCSRVAEHFLPSGRRWHHPVELQSSPDYARFAETAPATPGDAPTAPPFPTALRSGDPPPVRVSPRAAAWLFSCSLILGAVGLVGCAVESQRPDWDSGGDHKRDLAKRSPVGRAVTDSVDAGKGDHTDWKYIPVPGPGRLKLRVSVDNPKVGATILFIDNLGQPLGRARVDGKTRVYEFEEEVEEGKYFVKFQTAKFGSTYTIKTTFEPEEIAVVEPEVQAKTKRRRRKKKDKAEEAAAAAEEEGDSATTIVIVGKVVNKIPWADGKKTRITFDRGEVHGVKPGAEAVISGGPTMKVKEVHESASVGIARVKPAQITEGTKVTITVRSAGK